MRIDEARLYLVIDDRLGVAEAALRGGVDVVQLRVKGASDEDLLPVARELRRLCSEHDALFIVNDSPELALAADADGVHVGQDDVPPREAREIVGSHRLVGVSTHSPDQIAAASDADYIGVGPVFETPTKPKASAVGLELVREAARTARVPWFAIGGISAETLPEVLAAGAERIAVVRAIVDAEDPEAATRALRESLRDPSTRTAVLAFIDCINRGDVLGLERLLTVDHALQVFDEAPLVGRRQNLAAWRGYAERFPRYAIHPHRIVSSGRTVAILGHTTGSHLELPDAEESRLTVIWVAEVQDGMVRSWTLLEDTPEHRRRAGIASGA